MHKIIDLPVVFSVCLSVRACARARVKLGLSYWRKRAYGECFREYGAEENLRDLDGGSRRKMEKRV